MEPILDKKRVIIADVNTGNDTFFDYQMREMENLCEAIDFEVIETITQNLSKINSATYLGSGKIAELKLIVQATNCDYVIFNDELSPMQVKNIHNELQIDIMDRTRLILEIFKERARTKEAQLQVEIAELQYLLPRLAGSYAELSRTGGGGTGGGGARRGGGETKIELDRRHIKRRIAKAKEELQLIVQAKKTTRKARQANNIKTVAFVGYTNAGKSSMINTLLTLYHDQEEKQVFAKDMLFATLETATRRIKLQDNSEFLITDTVGFVSDLPHHLIESFKSTLKEIEEASLIVHVVDASSPYMELQIETTSAVLKELGVQEIPTIYAFNKIDQVADFLMLPTMNQPVVKTSCLDQTGFDQLVYQIKNQLFSNNVKATLLIPFDRGDIYSVLKEKADIISTDYQNDGILVEVILSDYLYNLYKKYHKD